MYTEWRQPGKLCSKINNIYGEHSSKSHNVTSDVKDYYYIDKNLLYIYFYFLFQKKRNN